MDRGDWWAIVHGVDSVQLHGRVRHNWVITPSPSRIGLITGHGLASLCLSAFFPLSFTVLTAFSDEFFPFNTKGMVAALVEKQWEKGVCSPRSTNKILELSLMSL